ncbi:MAG: PqqD family protein, partial [Candidatus Brocadiae bacterium]|nr:PqqD family protein [Candidatus Brocadiia bacterium]
MALRPKKPDFDLSGELQFEEYAPQLRRQTPLLRADTDIIPQSFRGKTYFVLQNPTTLQFYRVKEAEREILAQLDGKTSLGEIHERLRRRFGSRAPSFRELAHFVLMLRHANLTVPEPHEEARWGVERATKKRRDRVKQKFASFMYLTIPLLDPERILNAAMPYVRWAFTFPFLLLWLGTV